MGALMVHAMDIYLKFKGKQRERLLQFLITRMGWVSLASMEYIPFLFVYFPFFRYKMFLILILILRVLIHIQFCQRLVALKFDTASKYAFNFINYYI